ncbi:MAG: hypothetical protein KUG82_22735 [Pseudomonadales bacterium]|nr:hypothetical protein [Pseudomonadales bacterium]
MFLKRMGGILMSAILLLGGGTPSFAVDARFSGFGDVILGLRSDGPADDVELARYEANGSDGWPLNEHDGFTVTGVDFVTIVDLSEELTFLTEANLQTVRGGSSEIEIDIERIFLNYSYSQKVNFQTGLYFTPIGYHNRFLYSRAWLMDSIQIPDLFEEELNLVPTHSVGFMVHGTFPLRSGNSLRYIVNIANGRGPAPNAAIYARDPDGGMEFTWLLEWTIPQFNQSRFGLSGWMDQVDSRYLPEYGDEDPTTSAGLSMDEIGFNPYVVINTHLFHILAEYVWSTREDREGNLPQDEYTMSGFTFEISMRLKEGKLHPYIRYDSTSFEEEGGSPYLSVRGDTDEGFTRVYIPETQAVMFGAAYDVSSHFRLKTEFVHNMEGHRAENVLMFQAAFGF